MKKTVTLKINKKLLDKLPGATIRVEVDAHGAIKDKFWRDRLNDAKIDNCVEVVHSEVKTRKNKE